MKRTASNVDIGCVMLFFAAFFLGRWFFFDRAELEQLFAAGLMAAVGSAFLAIGVCDRSSEDQ